MPIDFFFNFINYYYVVDGKLVTINVNQCKYLLVIVVPNYLSLVHLHIHRKSYTILKI